MWVGTARKEALHVYWWDFQEGGSHVCGWCLAGGRSYRLVGGIFRKRELHVCGWGLLGRRSYICVGGDC